MGVLVIRALLFGSMLGPLTLEAPIFKPYATGNYYVPCSCEWEMETCLQVLACSLASPSEGSASFTILLMIYISA